MVGIETSETYEKGRPKAKGLSDPRLGTLDRSMKCLTDGANATDCPGYFGHLELAKPVFHVGFMSTILKVLRCVSVASSKLLLAKARVARACERVRACARANATLARANARARTQRALAADPRTARAAG